MENQTVNEGKAFAIISHLWLIGLIIAIFLNNSKKNSFTSFYIKQSIGINLLLIINKWLVYDMIGSFIGWAFGVVIFILWLISIIGALQGEEKTIPVIGGHFQDWFKNF
ncbi:hypothetical protein MC378_01750 [Polaribacter sp. MSW13]|uniref:Chloroplast import component protein (Tic20) n=1 Tax=Polaribacter marinus TaxID=2916838 RepID=A0A9X1VLS8_9FLAO|nr:hypothetical protein [Polaribacter marinus]MCI2227872.1 hypothetical protein [Polaribacter marinus]